MRTCASPAWSARPTSAWSGLAAGFVEEPDRRRLQELLRTGGDLPCRADLALCGPNGTAVLCAVALSPCPWARQRLGRRGDGRDPRAPAGPGQPQRAEGLVPWRLSSIGDAVITTDAFGIVTFMNRVAVE